MIASPPDRTSTCRRGLGARAGLRRDAGGMSRSRNDTVTGDSSQQERTSSELTCKRSVIRGKRGSTAIYGRLIRSQPGRPPMGRHAPPKTVSCGVCVGGYVVEPSRAAVGRGLVVVRVMVRCPPCACACHERRRGPVARGGPDLSVRQRTFRWCMPRARRGYGMLQHNGRPMTSGRSRPSFVERPTIVRPAAPARRRGRRHGRFYAPGATGGRGRRAIRPKVRRAGLTATSILTLADTDASLAYG